MQFCRSVSIRRLALRNILKEFDEIEDVGGFLQGIGRNLGF